MKLLIPLLCSFAFVAVVGISGCKKDPCKEVVCENGGTCVEGDCECLEAYTGANCENQVTPSVISISTIRLLSFPAVDGNGDPWDASSDPDLIVRFYKGSDLIWQPSAITNDADPGTTHSWNTADTVAMDSVRGEYSIYLYDHDPSSSPQFMGGYTFVPYSDQNGFPSPIVLDSLPVHFELDVSYTY